MSIVERAYSIILGPSEEWDVIANERVSAGGIFIGYAMIFAAIPVVIETMIIAYFGKDFAYTSATSSALQQVGVTPLVLMGAIKYVTALFALLVMCFLVNSDSAMFNGWSSMVVGTNLVVYASTPMWVAGPISILPYIGPLITIVAAAYVVYHFQCRTAAGSGCSSTNGQSLYQALCARLRRGLVSFQNHLCGAFGDGIRIGNHSVAPLNVYGPLAKCTCHR